MLQQHLVALPRAGAQELVQNLLHACHCPAQLAIASNKARGVRRERTQHGARWQSNGARAHDCVSIAAPNSVLEVRICRRPTAQQVEVGACQRVHLCVFVLAVAPLCRCMR